MDGKLVDGKVVVDRIVHGEGQYDLGVGDPRELIGDRCRRLDP